MTTRCLLCLSLMLTLIACGDKAGDSGGGGSDDCPAAEETGAELYTSNCAACHGADGSGASGPSLQDTVPTLSDSDILDTVDNGQGQFSVLFDGNVAAHVDRKVRGALFILAFAATDYHTN